MAVTTETLQRGKILIGGVPEIEVDNIELPTGNGKWNVNMGASSTPTSASRTYEANAATLTLHSNAVRRLQRVSVDGSLSGLGFLVIAYTPLDGAGAGLTHRLEVGLDDTTVPIAKDSGLNTVTINCPIISNAPVGITVV